MMTDKELMQQALEALTAYDGTNGASQRKRVLAALRERLAQPLVSSDGTSTWIDVPQRPVTPQEMQPCAGRNCGSTNPNLHSAECFEDYEKSTGMSDWKGLTEEEVMNCYMFWVVDLQDIMGFYKGVETKLKEKNT